MTIDATTAQKGEREEALEEAREHVRRCTGNEHLMTWEDSKRFKLAKALLSSSAAEGEMREALTQARRELWDALHSHMSEAEINKEVEYIDAALKEPS